ncbi:hypothetical protein CAUPRSCDRAFT_12924 [Caulochytrium protostelioides]|uniref:Uncharacterized protein n=1 Tax=Caulochytrium protostelioides TaxID=1555241 RepID=A0A4P9WW14_9FUNG|nr:hypothetical protein CAUPRSCDRAFT_12924 [Caulochytrium protostelioides]
MVSACPQRAPATRRRKQALMAVAVAAMMAGSAHADRLIAVPRDFSKAQKEKGNTPCGQRWDNFKLDRVMTIRSMNYESARCLTCFSVQDADSKKDPYYLLGVGTKESSGIEVPKKVYEHFAADKKSASSELQQGSMYVGHGRYW